jgi:hypothetical protein
VTGHKISTATEREPKGSFRDAAPAGELTGVTHEERRAAAFTKIDAAAVVRGGVAVASVDSERRRKLSDNVLTLTGCEYEYEYEYVSRRAHRSLARELRDTFFRCRDED